MAEHVLACDPGGRSGWASARMSEDSFEFTGSGVLREDLMPDRFAEWQTVGTLRNPTPTLEEYLPILHRPTFDVLVYESWYPRRDKQGKMDWIESSPLMAVQQIGALRWIARASGATIITQNPSDKPIAQATMPEALLVLDRDSNEQHDQDARMHLWLYFWRNWFVGKVGPSEVLDGV
jgi:hypothetical protein